MEGQLKEAAVVSMGTEISEEDVMNIEMLCDQVRDPPGGGGGGWRAHAACRPPCCPPWVPAAATNCPRCIQLPPPPLAAQVIALSEYRGQLYDYLRSRMAAVAPNLTVLVGELVGARLIAHVGSLVNLAKAPASTIQILGAEKTLFRWAAGVFFSFSFFLGGGGGGTLLQGTPACMPTRPPTPTPPPPTYAC